MQRDQHHIQNKLILSKKIGIVVSSYNHDITYPIRDAAITRLVAAGVQVENIHILEAPGGFEIPLLCQKMAQTGEYAGIIAIGCVIRGDTDHYIYISQESTRGIMDVMLKYDIPIANAILTVNTLEQAQIRSQWKTNKWIEAAQALIAMLSS